MTGLCWLAGVSGMLGTLQWQQVQPNELVYLPHDGPRQILTRGALWLRVAPPVDGVVKNTPVCG